MAKKLDFSLDNLRTDGWFERIGEGISSFGALCDIVGERFFAFSIIVGARITALTVDRRSPDLTLVDFVVGGPEDEDLEPQRLTLSDFRRRLIGALLVDDDRDAPVPAKDADPETLQLFIGVRYLLLAPLYSYSLKKLTIEGGKGKLLLEHVGDEQTLPVDDFRDAIRNRVREELENVSAARGGAIDLSKVAEAETLAKNGQWPKVIALLGQWPAPLAVFLRTPEGQMLPPEARATIAKGLGLLGSACVHLGEVDQAEEVFRVGIQYAQEGAAAAELYLRLGQALLESQRSGESIAPLRRALAFGGDAKIVFPMLARAFIVRGRYVPAYACLKQALAQGVSRQDVAPELKQCKTVLGDGLKAWDALSS